MRQKQFELILMLVGFIMFIIGFGLAWFAYPRLAEEQTFYILGGAGLLLVGVGFVLSSLLQSYLLGLKNLIEETKTIFMSNPNHRIEPDGPEDIKKLTKTINTFADRYQELLEDQSVQVQQAKTELEEEKNTLAALMSELTEGVLVCNIEGRILLYNNLAKQLLNHSPEGQWASKVGSFVGLGRSIFGLIDRNIITLALEDLAYRHKNKSSNLVSQFVTTATNGQLVRTRIAPILKEGEINGFVLTLEDVTQQTQSSRRRDMLLQSLTEGVRSSLANIRTAIETIEHYPEMEAIKLQQLRKIIYDESLTLSTRLNEITTEYETDLRADWELEEMLGNDLLWAIQRRFEDKLEVSSTIAEQEDNLWLRVDSYSVVQAMTYIMNRLKDDFGVTEVELYLRKTGQLAAFDLAWESEIVDVDTLWSWQNQSFSANGEGPALTLRDVAERHGGEVWCQSDKATQMTYFRLLLSITEPKPIQEVQVPQSSRPEYYDFDLFQQVAAQESELDGYPVMELSYTVFDTETTGLDPSGGDEIISVSAIRIVNGRLLRQEVFDQLVDPQRSLSAASTEIHGISEEMLQGQPTIEQVLPLLFSFSEGTVLVAHNAAFDMRLLQLKEAKTGIKFTNPVLDTLLLSTLTHPNQKDHSLEAIAHRLGVNIMGRHTSLGDAILTGEIFLKLIPLLQEQGIKTLAETREASQESYLARLEY